MDHKNGFKGAENVDYLQKRDFGFVQKQLRIFGVPLPPFADQICIEMSNVKEVLYLTVSLNTTMNDLKLMCCSAMCLLWPYLST